MISQDTVGTCHVDDMESICPPTSSNMPSPHNQRESELKNSILQQNSWQEISQNHKQKKLAESMLDLLDDICESSEAAINILNDLLNYENMDAGQKSVTNCHVCWFLNIFN